MVAIVTGGSKGIGLAIARAFLSRSMQVTITARKEAELENAARQLAAGDNLHIVRADVRDAGDAKRIVDDTVRRFGGVDVLVNNAGIGKFANVADMSLDDWRQILDTNLSGVFYCSRAAIPAMKTRGAGFIINISSLAGKNPFTGGAAYCASKAGLNAFSDALMQEVRYDNIRVSYVMPGSVSTGFAGHGPSGETGPSTQLGVDWKLAPDDVARVVVDLIEHDPRSLPSRVEIRPSRPHKN
jgi:NAD(P)-dependent dehydrogenase (short-subunit alcohol dehydrogenase family)